MRALLLCVLLASCNKKADAPTPMPAPDVPAKRAEGEACLLHEDCASGLCEGQGCDDAHPGVCVPQARPCTAGPADLLRLRRRHLQGQRQLPGASLRAPGRVRHPMTARKVHAMPRARM
jgi:hypothetical protein